MLCALFCPGFALSADLSGLEALTFSELGTQKSHMGFFEVFAESTKQ